MVVHEISTFQLQKEIEEKRKLVIKFTANWCSPCKYLAPIFKEVSDEVNAKCYEIDVDKEPKIAQQWGVLSVPTIVILSQGAESGRINGALPKKQLKERITAAL